MLIWTAFLWGLGVSCGAAFGLFLFVATVRVLDWATGKCDQAAASLEALLDRNKLTREANIHLATIAEAADFISDHHAK